MAWAKNGTPDTLGSELDTMTISDLTAKKINQYMYHGLYTGTPDWLLRFNNDSGSLYARRRSSNGGTDSTAVSQTEIDTVVGAFGSDIFHIGYNVWISGEEKLYIGNTVIRNTAGAGTAPQRVEVVGKYVPSPLTDTCDRIDIVNTQASAGYTTSSNLSALGTD